MEGVGVEPGLLVQLTGRRLLDGLVPPHEAAGQGESAAEGFRPPFDQQDVQLVVTDSQDHEIRRHVQQQAFTVHVCHPEETT